MWWLTCNSIKFCPKFIHISKQFCYVNDWIMFKLILEPKQNLLHLLHILLLESIKPQQAHMNTGRPFASHTFIWSHPLDTNWIAAASWPQCVVIITDLYCCWWDSRVVVLLISTQTDVVRRRNDCSLWMKLCRLLLNLVMNSECISLCCATDKHLSILLLCKILRTFHFVCITFDNSLQTCLLATNTETTYQSYNSHCFSISTFLACLLYIYNIFGKTNSPVDCHDGINAKPLWSNKY